MGVEELHNFPLTTDVESITGTDGDDTFIASDATFNTGDVLNGAAGTDKLNLTLTAVTTDLVDTDSIEQVYVRTTVDTSGAGDEVNASGWQGVEQLWNDRSTDVLAVTDVQSGVTLGINDTTENYTVGYADNAIGSTTATQSVVLTDTVTSTLSLTVGGTDEITTLNVSADSESTLTLAGGSDLETVTALAISGAGALDLVGGGEFVAVETADASANTGGVTLDLSNANQAVTVTGGSGADDIEGSDNNDEISTAGGDDAIDVSGGGDVTVDAGAGDDTVSFGGNLDANDTVDGGDGTDTLSANAAILNEANDLDASNISNIETISVADAADDETFDLERFDASNITFVADADGGNGAVVVDNVADNGIVRFEDGAGATNVVDVNVVGATGTGSQSLTVALADDGGAAQEFSFDATGVETINITVDEAFDLGGNAATVNVTDTSLQTLVISGTGADATDDLNLSGTDLGPNVSSVDASGLGHNLTVDFNTGAATGAEFTGSDNVDTVVGSDFDDTINGAGGADDLTGGAGADTINGGAGDDTITGGTGADILTGAAGDDDFVVAAGDTGITLATADTVTDFTTTEDELDLTDGGALTLADADTGGALADFAAFEAAATAAFGGANEDVYAAIDAAGSGNTYVAVDEDASGTFNAGDTLIVLNGINTDAELAAGDFAI